MKDPRKSGVMGFLLGSILTLLVIVMPVFASSGVIETVMNGVNIMIDGKVVAKVDTNYVLSNGEEVPYSIMYKDTTYLPIRKVSELLSKEIGYIAADKTVVLGAMPESTAAGWYLISNEFVPNPNDYELSGYVISSTMAGDKLSDKYTGIGEEGSYVITHERYVGNNTSPSYFGEALVEFSKPPIYLAPDKTFSMDLSHKIIKGDWGFTQTNIGFSIVKEIGYGAFGDIGLVDANGNGYFNNQSGNLTSTKVVPAGKIGDLKYLKVSLSNGYGYRYTYEWRE